MKTYFYQILVPYFAVIKAHNQDDALKVYEEIVADIEDKERFLDNLQEINEDKVRWELSGCVDGDTGHILTTLQQKEALDRAAPEVIIMEEP